MPSGKTSHPFIRDNKDGTVTVQYQPTEKGLHEMNIKYDGNHIPGQKALHMVYTTRCILKTDNTNAVQMIPIPM